MPASKKPSGKAQVLAMGLEVGIVQDGRFRRWNETCGGGGGNDRKEK
jgi:hypothetical protein